MPRFVVRVRMLDRPGALGSVASRIGAVGGDIVAVSILGGADGAVIDEFAVDLAEDLTVLLRHEIQEVDGATVEELREVTDAPGVG